MDRLHGRVAVVTGGGSGIGLAVVDRFRAEGATVVVGDLAPPASSAGITGVECDVTDESSVAALLAAAAGLGPVRALVTSAGIAPKRPVDEMPLDEWRRVLDINLTGTMLAIKHAVPAMRAAGGGSIVTVASIAAYRTGSPFNSAYAASKGAVVSMTRALLHELSPHGIRINALAPGIVASPLTAAFPEEWHAARAGVVPLDRFAAPSEMADVALFLASDESSYVTGHVLVADGGATAVQKIV